MAETVERQTLTFVITPEMQAELKKLEADGWIVDPENKPTMTVHVMRLKKEPAAVGLGELVIDETKIVIMRADGSIG